MSSVRKAMYSFLFLCAMMSVAASLSAADREGRFATKKSVAVASTEWVKGTRLWIALDVQNLAGKSVSRPDFPQFPLDFSDYDYRLIDIKADKLIHRAKAGAAELAEDQDEDPELADKGKMRMLIPLEWPGDNVKPGKHRLDLVVWAGIIEFARVSVEVDVRNPTKTEAAFLAKTTPYNAPITACPKGEAIPKSLLTDTGLGLEAAMFKMVSTRMPAKEMLQTLKTVKAPELFKPHLDVMKYELLRSTDKTAAAALRKKVLERCPGMLPSFESADRGMGMFRRGRLYFSAASPLKR